jgi:hypothetical protein
MDVMSAYWPSSWARLWADGREVVYVEAGGVDGPLLVGEGRATSPPGDVGLVGGPDADLRAYAAELRSLGIVRLEAKTDPHGGRELAHLAARERWAVLPIAGTVLIDLNGWNRGLLAKNVRRTLATAETAGYVGVECRWESLHDAWACYAATMARRAPGRRIVSLAQMDRFLADYEGDWRLYGARGPDGVLAASDVVLVDEPAAANPWGGSLDDVGSSPSVVSTVTALEGLAAEGIEVLNVGGGVEPGDQLEWFKTRLSLHAEVVPAWSLRWAA